MQIIVTGVAGFIGCHVATRLLERGDDVIGIDSLNDYYDVQLKLDRLALVEKFPNFTFHHLDLTHRQQTAELFKASNATRVVHLAAQAGVRYSLDNPYACVDSNLVGFVNILEACRHNPVDHLVFASSSSVYGANARVPFSVHDGADHPVSLYAASKKANELMAHSYSHLHQLPVTGIRFFTIYGPWGRPDMAYFKFARNILNGEPIEVYNHGELSRDFTYIDDAVEGVIRLLDKIPSPNIGWNAMQPDPATSNAPYRVHNIGNHSSIKLTDFIAAIEAATGIEAQKQYLPMQPGDVHATYADIEELTREVGYSPATSIQEGIPKFVNWYLEYYGVN